MEMILKNADIKVYDRGTTQYTFINYDDETYESFCKLLELLKNTTYIIQSVDRYDYIELSDKHLYIYLIDIDRFNVIYQCSSLKDKLNLSLEELTKFIESL